jgi:glycosyltransferase involved in cell wall biosynthesis
MKLEPLVTVGVPTFNRPGGLKRTLETILNQTYRNIEVVISDNGSASDETEIIVKEFSKTDDRIRFFKQVENKGIIFNFNFVLEKAKSDYFMWAADDDEWQGNNFLRSLMEYAPVNILTFPDAIVRDAHNAVSFPLKCFENCNGQFDYSRTFCMNGWGYPMYGLFNLKMLREHNLEIRFAEDLSYYMEGEFLHRLFLAGSNKYVPEAKINYAAFGSAPLLEKRIDDWNQYFKRTLLIYANSNLEPEAKQELTKLILDKYSAYSRILFEQFVSFKDVKKEKVCNSNAKSPLMNRIALRLRVTLKVFLKGHY